MRIRLDKLFLSAGLALAVIATTIPVGAAITTDTSTTVTVKEGLTLNNESVDLTDDADEAAFAKAVVGKETKATAAVNSLPTVTKTIDVTADKNTDSDTAASSNDIIKRDYGTEADAGKPLTYEVVVKNTYAYTAYQYVLKSAVENTSENIAAAKTEAVTAAKALVEESDVVEGTKFDYGTYNVSITKNTLTATEPGENPTAANAVYTVTGEVVVTETYIVNSLPSGYTYDILLGDAPESSKKYVVVRQDADIHVNPEEITNVTSVDGKGQLISVTDLTSTYFLFVETVSAKGALLFAPTTGTDSDSAEVTSGDDIVATIAGGTSEANTADYTKATNAPESATVVGYFTITVKKAGATVSDLGGATLEFKIAVPTDVTPSEGKKINWMVVRTHNGEVDILPATEVDGYIVFSTGYFSDYALIYTEVAADTTEEETNNETESATEAGTGTETTTAGGTSTTSKTSSTNTADNSMMPLFMTTLLLALCAGSLAIYKEKKTN